MERESRADGRALQWWDVDRFGCAVARGKTNPKAGCGDLDHRGLPAVFDVQGASLFVDCADEFAVWGSNFAHLLSPLDAL